MQIVANPKKFSLYFSKFSKSPSLFLKNNNSYFFLDSNSRPNSNNFFLSFSVKLVRCFSLTTIVRQLFLLIKERILLRGFGLPKRFENRKKEKGGSTFKTSNDIQNPSN